MLCVNETKIKGADISKHGSLPAIWSGVHETHGACQCPYSGQSPCVVLSERMMKCVKENAWVTPSFLWVRTKVGLNPNFIVYIIRTQYGKLTFEAGRVLGQLMLNDNKAKEDCDTWRL